MTLKILEKLKTHWHQLTASKKIEGAQHSAWLLAILLAGMAEFFKPPLKVCISGIDAVPCCTKLYLFKRGYWAKWQRKNTLKKLVARSALGCFLNWSQSLSSKSNEAGLVDCTWLALRFRVQIQFIYVQCAVHACDQQAASQTLFDVWEIVLAFGIMDQHGLCIGRVLHLEGISQLQSSPSQGLLAWSYKFCSFKPLNARLFLLCKDCQGILLIDFAKWEISYKLNNFSCLWAVGEALLAYNDCKSSGGWILDP